MLCYLQVLTYKFKLLIGYIVYPPLMSMNSQVDCGFCDDNGGYGCFLVAATGLARTDGRSVGRAVDAVNHKETRVFSGRSVGRSEVHGGVLPCSLAVSVGSEAAAADRRGVDQLTASAAATACELAQDIIWRKRLQVANNQSHIHPAAAHVGHKNGGGAADGESSVDA